MLKTLPLLGLILLFSLPKLVLGQAYFTTIPFKKPPFKQGQMFPHEDERGCKFLLVFHTQLEFRLLYLDEKLQLIEEKTLTPEIKSVFGFDIIHFINRPRTLMVYVHYPGEGFFTVFALDKRKGILTDTGLSIPQKEDVVGLNYIIQEDVFTVLQLEINSSNIRVYRSLDGYSYEADTMRLPIENLQKRLRKRASNDIPIITEEGGNSLLTNYMAERFYTLGSDLSFVFDDPDLGFAQRFDFDLANNRFETDTIYYPRFNEDMPLLQANSLLYEDLFVVSSIQEEGVKLAIYEFGKAEPTHEYAFATADELAPYFFEVEAERTDGEAVELQKDLFAYLQKSLIVSLEPDEHGDLWLMLGAYPHVSQGTQDLLVVGFMITTVVLGVTVGLQPTGISGLAIDPVGLVESTGNIINYSISRYNKFVYRVGLLQAQDLQLAEVNQITIPEATTEEEFVQMENEDAYEQMLRFAEKSGEYKPSSRSQIVFPYKNGLVLGYAKFKELKLFYFENR